MNEWIPIIGDGSDKLPPTWHLFEARLRDGRVWKDLAVTRFCLKVEGGPFRHRGKPDDPVEYRMEGKRP